jgi:hypothetical protein
LSALGDDRVAWLYGAIGAIIILLALIFKAFTALGHAEDYLPAKETSAAAPAQLENGRLAPDTPDLA